MNSKALVTSKALVAALAVIALAVGVFAYFFLFRPDVEEASVTNAIQGAAGAGEGDSDGAAQAADDAGDDAAGEDAEGGDAEGEDAKGEEAGADGAAELEDASGAWVVTTEIGEFTFADASATFAGFRVAEELRSDGDVEAVGRTPAVAGGLTIDGTTLTDATIEADFTQLVSDRSTRDRAMRRAMNVAANPTGTFTLSDPVDFGTIPAEGGSVTFQAAGDLTVNGITQPVTFDMEASVSDGSIIVAGSSPVVFADHDIEAPTLGPVVSIAQEGTIEVQVWFVAA